MMVAEQIRLGEKGLEPKKERDQSVSGCTLGFGPLPYVLHGHDISDTTIRRGSSLSRLISVSPAEGLAAPMNSNTAFRQSYGKMDLAIVFFFVADLP